MASAGGASDKRRRPWFWQTLLSPMTAPPSSPASLYRPTLRRLLSSRLKDFMKRSSPTRIVIVGILFLFALSWMVAIAVIYLVGPRGSIKGGQLGYIWDQYGRDYTRYQTISKWREEVRSELHIPVVYRETEGALLDRWFYPFDVIIKTRPNYAVVEMLLREKRRAQRLEIMQQNAGDTIDRCSKDEGSALKIPTTVLQWLPNHEQPPLPPYWIARPSGALEIDTVGMHKSDINQQLAQRMESCQSFASHNHATYDADLLCLAYHLGGMQMSNSRAMQQSQTLINDVIFSLLAAPKMNPLHGKLGGGSCNSRVGYAVFSNAPTPDDELRRSSAIASSVSTIFSAFPPNHPASICIPPLEQSVGVSPYNQANEELSFRSTFVNKLLTGLGGNSFDTGGSVWGVATLPCDFDSMNGSELTHCCNQVTVTILDAVDGDSVAKRLNKEQNSNNHSPKHHMIFTTTKDKVGTQTPPKPLSVEIREVSPSNVKPALRQKESIETDLRNKWRCEPSWLCNRSLQSSIYGSFSSCASCSKCAVNAICNESDAVSTKRVNVDVRVSGLSLGAAGAPQQNRIPRIIHQTYFDGITIEKYPQLFRLQNTWRASGWDYRFYTDETARQYIEANYPSRFVSVFDSLLPGAYKADFFRYLVLYKDGGIYVDVDVMLGTNLDAFIAPDMAFFAPIDAVGSFADETFCVWNGLLGSAPAHPALTNVIEWMVNLVSSRGDMYDMERAVCRYSGVDRVENWKVRAEPGLMLSGPCALGLAVNRALGNEPLARFRPGLLRREGYNTRNVPDLHSEAIGNVMILVADKDDLGAFRFTDPERNIIVASTDLQGLSKSPMTYDWGHLKGGSASKQRPHYSVSTRGQMLWGTHHVYADDLIAGEQISMAVSYV